MKQIGKAYKKVTKRRDVKSEQQVFRKAAFDTRKKKYEVSYHFIEDVEYPSKIQRFFMVTGNPFWYNFILAVTFIDAMIYMHAVLVSRHRLITSEFKYQLMFEISVAIFKAVDIFLAICVEHIMKLEFHNEAHRPVWVLICEIIGAIPLYPPVPIYIIKTGHFIKFIRLFYHIYSMRVSLRCKIRQRVFNFILSLIICETIYAWIYFHIANREPSWDTYMQLFELSSSALLGKGGIVSMTHYYSDSVYVHEVPLACGIILVLFMFLKPTLCDIICLLTMQYESKYKYIFKVHFFEIAMSAKYKCSSVATKSILSYLRNFWITRQGCINTPEMEMSLKKCLPRSLIMEMRLDSCYDFFRHSQLFRGTEIPIMRNLAPFIENVLYMKGEYVCTKRSIIDYMFYINSGTVEILSTENGDSGLICLGRGTTLGEVSLFYPYKSTINIRCRAVTHLFILYRKDFVFLIRNYPFVYDNLLKTINSRLKIASKINEAKQDPSNKYSPEEQIIWLKAMLHGYKATNPALVPAHRMTNIYMAPFLSSLIANHNPLCHTVRFLDMLSIERRIDADMDLVFLRSKCIWILKHDSPVYKFWHCLIAFFAFIMLLLQPYVLFNESTVVLQAIIVGINCLFVLDLILSLMTPASSTSQASTLSEIFAERVKSFEFYLDICSVFYFNMYGHVFPFRDEQWTFIFHTVKLWKVYRLLNSWEHQFKLNLLLQRYCVFVFSQVIYVYTLGYILYMDRIIDGPFDPVGVQIATGVGFKVKSGHLKLSLLYTLVNTFSAVFEGLGVVTVTTANYMKYIRISRIYRNLDRLYHLSRSQTQLFKRLNSYLSTQINDNSAFVCAYNIPRFFNFSSYYNEVLKSQIFYGALAELEFFRLVPRGIVKQVSSTASTQMLHQHALILSYGTKYEDIYIVVRGQARTVYGNKYYVTKLYTPLNLIEVLFNMPCASNVVSITETEVVSFHYPTFLNILNRYKNQATALQISIANNKEEVTSVLETIITGKQVVIKTLQVNKEDQFHVFSLKNVYEDSFEEFDYYVPYDQSSWGFMKFILMKKTILPESKFLYWWEVSRCIFAYISCLVFLFPPIALREVSHPCTYVLIALDATAFMDIFVRMHVCYYDAKGVLITHPLYTAANYVRKSFIVDLMGCIPFYLLVSGSPQYKIIVNILHVFQIHRLFGFKAHFFYTTYIFDYIFIVLTIICPVNFITCFIFVMDCYDWENEANSAVKCTNFMKESPLGNYVTIAYFIMSTLTCSGTGSVVNLENVTPYILHIVSCCSFLSTFIRIYVTAYLFGSYNKLYIGNAKQRDKIRRLITCLKQNHVRPYLRKQFKIYYELKWRWFNRLHPFNVLEYLNTALRRDMLYCLYGEHMHENTQLDDISNRLAGFFKNILMEAKAYIIPKNGYIITINDIHSNVYLLHKGSVDVVAANGTVFDTIYDGSIFGNLDNENFTRQKVSFVTNTVVKYLVIKGTSFRKILDQYPVIKTSFCNIKHQKFYYIPSNYEETEYQKAQWTWKNKELKAGFKKYKWYHILSWIHFVFPCCIGLTMELYQIATGEMQIAYILIQYIFDIIHLVHQYLKFVTPYMTQEQEFVMHPIRIKAHSMRKKRIQYKLYFLNLPFDWLFLGMLILTSQPFYKWSLLFSILRLNRLSRWVNIVNIYSNSTKKVASFSRIFRVFMLFLMLIYSSLILATIIEVCDYSYTYYLGRNESQIIREMPVEHLINSRSTRLWNQRAELYGRYWFFSLLLHTFSHDNIYYPQETAFETLFIVLFLYVTVFESVVMIQYYQVLMESTTLVKIVYAVRRYIEVYYNISNAAYVLREIVDEAMYHYYAVKSVADDYLMVTDSPNYLREAAMMSMYGYLLARHPYFSGCHPDFLRQLVMHMHSRVYPINGIIANRRDCFDTIYFVHKGEVAAMQYENDCTPNAVFLYCKGDSFGFEQGFKNVLYQYTYKCVTFVEMMELKWHECSYLTEFFPMSDTFISKTKTQNIKHYIHQVGREQHARKKRV